jgi:hypothetical protein
MLGVSEINHKQRNIMSYLNKPKIIRKKTGDQQYDLLTADGIVVGSAVKTGSHLDHYPWDWALSEKLAAQLKDAKTASGMPARTQGPLETLRDCVDAVATAIAHYNLTVR